MNIKIGRKVLQKEGYKALVLNPFPNKKMLSVPSHILSKASEAERMIGKLDGVSYQLPDINLFIRLFNLKDAEASSQIEGTKATLMDVLEEDTSHISKVDDTDDIIFYMKAFDHAMRESKRLPLSLRLIREMHRVLMEGARQTHYADPGNFRKSQNWIGDVNPSKAKFVPPPPFEMKQSLNDFEKFLHRECMTPLIHIGISHAHFETIHPFLDGNGRVGRLLISFLLKDKGCLEHPVLFLSSYFKKHQAKYYEKLTDYHDGRIESWVTFFLEAVIAVSKDSITVCKKISDIRKRDLFKIEAWGKRESESGIKVLQKFYSHPIADNKMVMEWTGFTRAGAQKVLDRFEKEGIILKHNEKEYMHGSYLRLFLSK